VIVKKIIKKYLKFGGDELRRERQRPIYYYTLKRKKRSKGKKRKKYLKFWAQEKRGDLYEDK